MVIRKQQRLLLYLGIIVFLSLSLRSSLKNGGVAAWLPTQLQDDYFFTSSQQPRLSSSLSSSTTESATSRSTSNQTTKTTTTTTQRRDRLLPEGQSHRTSPERIIRGLSIAENNNNDNDAKDDATTTDDDGDDDHNNTNTTSNRRPSEQQPPLTIIVALSGEMGNNLGKLAHGICLEEWLRDDFGVGRTQLVLRHQAHPKWKRGQAALQRCFPWTRTLQFAAGNTPSLDAWDAIRPADWPTWFRNMRQVNTFDIANITQALQYTVDLYRQQQQQSQQGDANDRQSTLVPDHLPLPRVLSMNDGDNNNNNRRKRRRRASISNDKGNMNTTINVSLPFIWANKFAIWDVCVDRYYDKLRDVYFAFDEEACCGEARPYPDEAVFVSTYRHGRHLTVWFYCKGSDSILLLTAAIRILFARFSLNFVRLLRQCLLPHSHSTFATFWAKWYASGRNWVLKKSIHTIWPIPCLPIWNQAVVWPLRRVRATCPRRNPM